MLKLMTRKIQQIMQTKTKLEWALFDMFFKPFACCAIIILERWFAHRANVLFDFGSFYIDFTVASRDLAHDTWGTGWTTGMVQKTSSLIALFLQSDNAYMCFFRRWIKVINKVVNKIE